MYTMSIRNSRKPIWLSVSVFQIASSPSELLGRMTMARFRLTWVIAYSTTMPLDRTKVAFDSMLLSILPFLNSSPSSRLSKTPWLLCRWAVQKVVLISIRAAKAMLKSCVSAKLSFLNYGATLVRSRMFLQEISVSEVVKSASCTACTKSLHEKILEHLQEKASSSAVRWFVPKQPVMETATSYWKCWKQKASTSKVRPFVFQVQAMLHSTQSTSWFNLEQKLSRWVILTVTSSILKASTVRSGITLWNWKIFIVVVSVNMLKNMESNTLQVLALGVKNATLRCQAQLRMKLTETKHAPWLQTVVSLSLKELICLPHRKLS